MAPHPLVILRRIGHRSSPEPALSDAQWAPPYDVDETGYVARMPDPWPPLPPALPAQPTPPAGDDPAPPLSPRPQRRALAIGATIAVLATWVAVAAFHSPASSKTDALAQPSAPPAPNGYGGGLGGFYRRGTAGVVQSVVGPTVTVLDGNGQSVTVQTSGSTAFIKTAKVSVHQVQPGDTIVATGTYAAANATLTAGRIAILGSGGTAQGGGRSSPAQAGGNSALGTVTSITGDELAVSQFDGTVVTVIASPSVTVTAPVAGSLRDLARGQSITVRGPGDDNGTIDAYQIEEGTSMGFFGPGSFGFAPNRVVQS